LDLLISFFDETHNMSDRSRRSLIVRVIFVMGLLFLAACMPEVRPPIEAPQALLKLSPEQFPNFRDDMSIDSLETAMKASLEYLNRIDPATSFRFGPDVFTTAHLKESLQAFRAILQRHRSPVDLKKAIETSFWVYKSVGRDGHGGILFTGYYEPVLVGSPTCSDVFRYPIYRKPDDWVRIDLKAFGDEFGNKRIVGRHVGHAVVPYFTRQDIDSSGRLDNKGYELLWVSDRVALFFLQVQGSGKVVFHDGSFRRVNYDCSNGRRYRSIGRLLIEEGKIAREDMSLQQIRLYLKKNPEEVERILNYNERYVFFRFVDDGPLGAIEVPLSTGRSIATDLNLFPRAALAFIETEKPVPGENGLPGSWQTFGRFVLNHDTGEAIRGPGRVDIFWGAGSYAEMAAGHMKQQGVLYFLVKKPAADCLM